MCTFFRNKNEDSHFIGKNYDVPSPCSGLIFWNPAGIRKRALIKSPEEPVEWTSKYGNVTFNQVGRDFPASGMNEKGLVVEQTALWNTIYPDKDKRKAIKELQLIQYVLDVCSSTGEALECIKNIRVSQEMAKLQYIISDNGGDISLVEFILGKMKVYSGNDFAYQVITNDMIGTSIDYLNTHVGFGGTKAVKYSKYSLDRYVVTVDAIHNSLKSEKITNAFDLLNLSEYEDTQWQIVYDLVAKSIRWRTKSTSIIHKIQLTDFTAVSECIVIETDNGEHKVYTRDRNRMLVTRFFKEAMSFKAIKVSDKEIEILSSYPEIATIA